MSFPDVAVAALAGAAGAQPSPFHTGLIIILLLVTSIIAKEVLVGTATERGRRLSATLTATIVPLVICFLVILIERLA